MVWHVFHPMVARDASTGALVGAGSGTIHATTDTAGITPLAVTDLSGVAWPGGLVPVVGGLVAGFRVEDHTRVVWRSGVHVIAVWSPEAMEASAISAAAAAGSAAADAVAGAVGQITATTTAILTATGYAPVLVAATVGDIPPALAHPTVIVIPGVLVDPDPDPVPDPVAMLGWTTAVSNGTDDLTLVAADAAAAVGDLMIAAFTMSTTTQTVTAAGWDTLVAHTAFGTRSMQILTRRRQVGDPASYAFTPTLVAAFRGALMALGGADDTTAWVAGAVGTRAITGTPTTNVAPGVAAPASALVLTISHEATTADDTVAPTVTAGGATDWFWTTDNSTPSTIETVFAAWRQMEAAATTEPVTVTYQNTQTSNGAAVQIAVPRAPIV